MSFAREICEATGQADIAAALCHTGIISHLDMSFELSSNGSWYRSGAETYTIEGQLRTEHGLYGLILKACVSFGGRPISEVLDGWLFRRQLLARWGIKVPYLYCRGRGVILEEKINYTLAEAYDRSSFLPSLTASLGRLAATLAGLGFQPVSLHDLRSRGNDVVMVDFGEDLGSPFLRYSQSDSERVLKIAETALVTAGQRSEQAALRRSFMSHLTDHGVPPNSPIDLGEEPKTYGA